MSMTGIKIEWDARYSFRAAWPLALLLCIMQAAVVRAHHSFAAAFDATQPVIVDGSIVRVEWRNPHAWIYVIGHDDAGTTTTWAIEASAPAALSRRGARPDLFLPGTRVRVRGYRAKNATPTIRGRDLIL